MLLVTAVCRQPPYAPGSGYARDGKYRRLPTYRKLAPAGINLQKRTRRRCSICGVLFCGLLCGCFLGHGTAAVSGILGGRTPKGLLCHSFSGKDRLNLDVWSGAAARWPTICTNRTPGGNLQEYMETSFAFSRRRGEPLLRIVSSLFRTSPTACRRFCQAGKKSRLLGTSDNCSTGFHKNARLYTKVWDFAVTGGKM